MKELLLWRYIELLFVILRLRQSIYYHLHGRSDNGYRSITISCFEFYFETYHHDREPFDKHNLFHIFQLVRVCLGGVHIIILTYLSSVSNMRLEPGLKFPIILGKWFTLFSLFGQCHLERWWYNNYYFRW